MLTNDDPVAFHHAPPQAIIPENGFHAVAQNGRPDDLSVEEEETRKCPETISLQRDTNSSVPAVPVQLNRDNAKNVFPQTGTSGVCLICRGYFQRLDRHVLTHEDRRPFSCSKCQEGFRQRIHLLRHLETHERQKRFPCTYCGKVLTRKDKLKQHMSRTCKVLREY